MTYKVVIPARLASTRLPRKPLVDILGKPMILRTAEQAAKAVGSENVVVAVDHEDVAKAVEPLGFRAVMTSEHHQTGTDRIAEVAVLEGWDDRSIVVNVQGDEPLIPPELIEQVASELARDPTADAATLSAPIRRMDDVTNPNIVKVVLNDKSHALYFSRGTIPFPRDEVETVQTAQPFLRHIGIYAYRVRTLKAFTAAEPVWIEEAEKLEQLRILYHGGRIRVAVATVIPHHGVDTEDMLAAVRHHLMSASVD